MRKRLPPGRDEPLYVRLKRALRQHIGNGLQPDDALPSEFDLCRDYGVSRMTVRLALSALANEGVVVRRQGKGTYVAHPKRGETVAYFGSFTEEVQAQGRSDAARLVSFEIIRPDPRIARKLRIPLDDDVIKLRRVRYVDGEPMCYQVSYLARARFPALDPAEFEGSSLFARLEGTLGEPLVEAEESVEAMRADPFRAKLLGIKTGAALLVIERLVFSRSGLAAEYNRSFYKAESARLLLRSQRAVVPSGPFRLSFANQEASHLDD